MTSRGRGRRTGTGRWRGSGRRKGRGFTFDHNNFDLVEFLEAQAEQEEQLNKEEFDDDGKSEMNESEKTFAVKMGYNKDSTVSAIKRSKEFELDVRNRHYETQYARGRRKAERNAEKEEETETIAERLAAARKYVRREAKKERRKKRGKERKLKEKIEETIQMIEAENRRRLIPPPDWIGNREWKPRLISIPQHLRDLDSNWKAPTTKKKKKKKSKDSPLEIKIYDTPLGVSEMGRLRNASSFSGGGVIGKQHGADDDDKGYIPRDPRFPGKEMPNEDGFRVRDSGGWELRNAYKFLDEAIDRDIGEIEKRISKHKKTMKWKKKNATDYSDALANEFADRGSTIKVLKKDLIALKNRKHHIGEKDLEQKTRSDMRKQELQELRGGKQNGYHHSLKKNLNGKLRTVIDSKKEGTRRLTMNEVFMRNKYQKLKAEGNFERYMNKKRKRLDQKARKGLTNRSGAGWKVEE